MILKMEKNTHATYLVKIQGDNKYDITIKEIRHRIGIDWGRNREVLFHSDKKSETLSSMGGGGALGVRKEGMKREVILPLSPPLSTRHSVLTL